VNKSETYWKTVVCVALQNGNYIWNLNNTRQRDHLQQTILHIHSVTKEITTAQSMWNTVFFFGILILYMVCGWKSFSLWTQVYWYSFPLDKSFNFGSFFCTPSLFLLYTRPLRMKIFQSALNLRQPLSFSKLGYTRKNHE